MKVSQCCQLGDFLARFSDFSDPLRGFVSKKWLAPNLATYSDHQGKGEKYIVIHMLLRVNAVHSSSAAAPGSLPSQMTAKEAGQCVWGLAGAAGADTVD